jgi:hypothetical protein
VPMPDESIFDRLGPMPHHGIRCRDGRELTELLSGFCEIRTHAEGFYERR